MELDKKLYLVNIKEAKESHIKVDKDICRDCKEKYCIYGCPSGVYELDNNGDLLVLYERCLECGACRVVCHKEAITWTNPDGGFGVSYKYG
jgi:ferredoxin like protein